VSHAPGRTTASAVERKVQDNQAEHQKDGPTCRFATSPEVGLGSLSVPCRQGTPTTDIKIRQPVEHATMSRCVFRGSRPHLPTREGSGAVTCSTAPDLASECSSAATHPMALDPASLLGRASASPHVIHLRTPPPRWRGL
jgi:hypothetical protein